MNVNKEQNWVKNSAIAGIAAMVLTGILLYLPFSWISIVLLVGVLVFVMVLIRNPKYFYRRMASYLIGSFVVIGSMPIIEVQKYFSDNSFAIFAAQNLGTGFYIIMGLIIIAAIIADLISNNELFSKKNDLKVEKTRDKVFEKFTEFEKYIREVVFEEIKSGKFEPNNWERIFELENYLRTKSTKLSQPFYSKSSEILLTFQNDVNSVGNYMRSIKENIDRGNTISISEYGEGLTKLTNEIYQNYRIGIDELKNIE